MSIPYYPSPHWPINNLRPTDMKYYAQGHTILEQTLTLDGKLISPRSWNSQSTRIHTRNQDWSTRPAVAGCWRESEFLLAYWACGDGRNFVYSKKANRTLGPKEGQSPNVWELKGLHQIVLKQNAFFHITAIVSHLGPRDQAKPKTAGGSIKKHQFLQDGTPTISLR